MATHDPLEKVFVDNPETDRGFRAEIRDLLQPYLWLTGKGQVNFTSPYYTLNLQGKIFLYLMGRWVLAEMKIRDDGAGVQEIEQDTGIPNNSIRPTLVSLCDLGAVRRTGQARALQYRAIPGHAWMVKLKKWQR